MKEDKKDLDPTEILNDLMKNHGMYFTNERYRTPTSRYEAWLMASCLSNLIIAKTLEKAFERVESILSVYSGKEGDIFQKQPESLIIKDKEIPDAEIPLGPLNANGIKRRKRE